MKRSLIAVLTIAVLLLAFSGLAVAADKTQEAAERLVDLGFVEGYEDGSLGLDNSITRAEFAKIAVIAAGYGDAEAMLRQSPTSFSDVGTGLWYTGWINVASSQGFVKGDPGGTYRPNDTISAAEVVTVLLRVLGYNDNLIGQWPTNYLVKAAGLGITKDIDFEANAAIVRGKVFQMLSKTLDADVVEYDHESVLGFVVKEKAGVAVTLLEDALDLVKVKGYMTAIPRITKSLEDDQVEIGGTAYDVKTSIDCEKYFGAKVVAYITKDDKKEVLSVKLDEENTIIYDALKDITADELTVVAGDREYDFAAKADMIGTYVDAEKAALSATKYDYAKVVLNKSNKVVFVDAYTWDDFLVVEEVDGDIVYGYGDELNAKKVTIVKDGATIALADLEEGDILFYNRNARDGYAEVYNKSVVGEIERIYDNSVKVEGKEYKRTIAKYLNEDDKVKSISSDSLLKDIAEAMQDAGDVAVFLNRAGDMVFLSGDISDIKTTSSYVFVTADSSYFTDRGSAKWTFDILNVEGAEVKYDVSHKDAETDSKILKNTAGAAIKWDDDGNTATGTANILKKDIVELKLDNAGKIDEVALLVPHPEFAAGYEFKTTSNYYMGLKIDPEAAVFLIEDYIKPDGKIKDIDIELYKDLDFDYINAVTFYQKDDKIVALVVEKSSREDDSKDHLTVATADDSKVAGKTQYTLKLVIDGEKVTVDTKSGISSYPGVNKGDLLEVKIDKKTGSVNSVTKLPGAQKAEGKVSAINNTNKSLTIDGTAGYKLGVDGVVVDATDSYKVIPFSALKNGDTVNAARVIAGSNYLEVIVRTAKAGSAPVVDTEVVTDGTVTYIDPWSGYVIINDKEIDVIGSAAEFFANGAIAIGDKIAFELSAGGKMFKITAIDGDLTLDSADNYSTFADLVVNGDLVISTTGAAGPPATYGTVTASNVTVKGNLTVAANATLAATKFVVEGDTVINGTATFNSELKGDVVVSATGNATFKNVEMGADLTVNPAATVVFDGATTVDGTITGASVITFGPDATQATQDAVQEVVDAEDDLAAAEADVAAELLNVADSYVVPYGTTNTNAAKAAAAKALVEADVDTTKVNVAVAYNDPNIVVTLTSKDVDTVSDTKNITVTIASFALELGTVADNAATATITKATATNVTVNEVKAAFAAEEITITAVTDGTDPVADGTTNVAVGFTFSDGTDTYTIAIDNE